MSQSDGRLWSVGGRRMVGKVDSDDIEELTITEAWLEIYSPVLIVHVPVDRNCVLHHIISTSSLVPMKSRTTH